MHWLHSIDVGLFHWVNPAMSNPVLDVAMPFCSGNPWFGPILLLACIGLVWKGGARGRLCVLMLVLAVVLGDTFICRTLKELVHRPRPFWDIPDAHVPASIGRSDSGSMPSSHAANWFAATLVMFIYYRRSLRFMLPAAALVAFSRVYNGVHYPSDVLVGAILGAGYAAAGVWTLDALWGRLGPKYFPLWWVAIPSLIHVKHVSVDPPPPEDKMLREYLRSYQWLNFAYCLIFLQLAVQLIFAASGRIGIAEDEAYQWLWSKHLALSYYSKPALIAFTHFLSTFIWGDTVFGIHFFPPILSAVIQIALLRFLARTVNARAAFWAVVLCAAVPLLLVGNTLMTVDPLLVTFWTLAMLTGWRAVQLDSRTRDWVWFGVWMGLGFLSKYTALYQWVCLGIFMALWPPARAQLRRPGPWLALLINLLCLTPVVIWNSQHNWITVSHVASNGNLNQPWAFTAANLWRGFSKFTTEFVLAELLFLNPFFLIPAVWAAFAFWKKRREEPLMLYFFCLAVPVFLGHLLFTFHSRVLPNWIAPAVLPLFCLGVLYWDRRWEAGHRRIKCWLIAGLVFGGFATVILHDPNVLTKLAGRGVPTRFNPLRRVTGWKETAEVVEAAREKLLAEGRPVFLIGGHYGITGEMAFHLPEAKAAPPDRPLVYYLKTATVENQFYFWPGYENRKGENAIFAQELDFDDKPAPALREELRQQFESVKDLGAVMVQYHGKPIRKLQLAECRGLR